MKIQFLVLTFSVLFVLSSASRQCGTRLDTQICAQFSRRCRETKPVRIPALPTDSLAVFNADCRKRTNGWRNVEICDMLWAVCEITIIKCDKISCRNVAASVRRLRSN